MANERLTGRAAQLQKAQGHAFEASSFNELAEQRRDFVCGMNRYL
jgi:hypothetical protein